jgi:integrase
MALYKRGGVWWCTFQHRGKPVYESTHVRVDAPDSKRAANEQQTLIRARVALESGPGGAATAQVSLADLEEFHLLKIKDLKLGERRVDDVEGLWKHIHAGLGEHTLVSGLTAVQVESLEAKWRKAGIRGQTIRKRRQALLRGLKIAQKEGLIELPFRLEDLEPITSSRKLTTQSGKYRSRDVLDAVYAKLSAKAVTAGHRGMLRFVELTGLREGEIGACGGYEVRGQLMHVEATKVEDSRWIPLTEEALEIWKRWRHRFASADLQHSLWRASKKAGVRPGVTLRDLRATYITNLAKKNLPAAQKLAGHKSVATTAIYVDAQLEDAIESYQEVFGVLTEVLTVTAKADQKTEKA